MSWALLSFLAEPAFVIAWYAIGIAGAAYVAYDLGHRNTPLKQAMKWAWPIIVLFFSVIGIALYFGTARAPGIAGARSEEEKRMLHERYERSMFRRVNGAVIHCVAGDGLGIMTAMVIARLLDMTFWQEFWFEYAVGFAFGWFIFQLKSMKMMTDNTLAALWMAFRSEFFSMLTVMGGMGAVMTFVTPNVVGAQPDPLTYAFWGFGMLGLLLGYVFTFPMNWMLVMIGWKHGMGSSKDAHPVESGGARASLAGAMTVLGVLALGLPAWLTELREGKPVGTAVTVPSADKASAAALLERGLHQSLEAAGRDLAAGRRAEAVLALDAAMRASQVAVVQGTSREPLETIRRARHRLQNGDARGAQHAIVAAAEQLAKRGAVATGAAGNGYSYADVPVLNARGAVIGEVRDIRGGLLDLALGGIYDVWGFWDVEDGQVVSVSPDDVLLGPRHALGKSFVMLATLARTGE